jgi:AraC-like DNA-binding protein
VLAALPPLADREPVPRVATAVGYASPSSFLAAFRHTMGCAPTRFFAEPPTAARRPMASP